MGALAVLVFLWALSQRGGSSSSNEVPPKGTTDGSPPPAGDSRGGGDGLGGLGAIVPILVSLIPTSTGGGAAVVGGSTGAVITGGGAGTTGGGVVAGTTVGGAAALPIGAIMVGLLANPIAWAIYILIASKVVQAQENEKDWQSNLFALDVNARALHLFEQTMTRSILEERGQVEDAGNRGGSGGPRPAGLKSTYTVTQQVDQRLDRTLMGSHVRFNGWRSTYNFTWVPGDETKFRQVRALALEYLRLRAMYGYRMLRYFLPGVATNANWGFVEAYEGHPYDTRNHMFEEPGMPGNMPGIGGLLHIPLAASGVTVSPRLDNNVYPNDPLQLRPPPWEADPINDLTTADRQSAKLSALLEAVFVMRWDPRPGMDLDAEAYAKDVLAALGTTEADGNRYAPEGVTAKGGLLLTDPSVFGVAAAINPQAIRQNKNDAGHPKIQVMK